MTRAVTGGAGLRVLRLAAFAVAATCLALGSHLIAGGYVPGVLPTVLACALPGIAGAVLTRRRRGPVDILVVLGAVQVAMHEVFAATAVRADTAMPAGCPMGMMGLLGSGATGMTGHPGTGEGAAAGGGLIMLVAHLFATVATAALLARGEQGVHVLMPLVDWMRRGSGWTVPSVRRLPVVGRRSCPVTALPSVPRLGLVAIAGIVRRGPPTPVW